MPLPTWYQESILTGKIIKRGQEMKDLATTRMSSKGQVVIPEEIRNKLGLKAGSQFVVVGDKDTVILKAIVPPSMDDLDDLINEAQKQAHKAGLKQSDISAAVARVRKNR